MYGRSGSQCGLHDGNAHFGEMNSVEFTDQRFFLTKRISG